MKADYDIYLTLALQFALMSLMAFGGANTAVPEMYRQTVEVHGWISARTFSELFAIAQASPGPNIVVVTLIGQQVAGIAGGLLTTLAMIAPSSALAFVVALAFDRFKQAKWRSVAQAGLVPVTIGLVAASGYIVARAADRDFMTFAVTATTFVIAYRTKITPLIPLAFAAALGFAGVL